MVFVQIGFEMIDAIAEAEGIPLRTIQHKALLGKGKKSSCFQFSSTSDGNAFHFSSNSDGSARTVRTFLEEELGDY